MAAKKIIKEDKEVVLPDARYRFGENPKQRSDKLVPILVLTIILMSFGLGALWSKVRYLEQMGVGTPQAAAQPQQQPQAQAPQPVVVDKQKVVDLFGKDLIKFGNAQSKLLFVEVADPSCPFCHIAAGKNPELNAQAGERFKLVSDGGSYVAPVIEMKKLVDQGKAAYVYIYSNGHGNGEIAQKAMYCAYEQGKFWEAHDKLMTNAGYELINNVVKNDKANIGKMVDFLQGSGVETGALTTCLESGKYDDRIASDQTLARELGVQGTPGFFLNETNFAGAYSWTDMKSVADAALK